MLFVAIRCCEDLRLGRNEIEMTIDHNFGAGDRGQTKESRAIVSGLVVSHCLQAVKSALSLFRVRQPPLSRSCSERDE